MPRKYDKFSSPYRKYHQVFEFEDPKWALVESGSDSWELVEEYAPIASKKSGFAFLWAENGDLVEIWAGDTPNSVPYLFCDCWLVYSRANFDRYIKRHNK